MSGHAILHAMDDMIEGSRGASVLEHSSFSVSFLEKIIKESGSRLGYGELKNEQMKAILSFVQGNDTFVLFYPPVMGSSCTDTQHKQRNMFQ